MGHHAVRFSFAASLLQDNDFITGNVSEHRHNSSIGDANFSCPPRSVIMPFVSLLPLLFFRIMILLQVT
jgi:hypothetical protein